MGAILGVDPEEDDLGFSLVEGDGDDGNESFAIENGKLVTTGPLNYETKSAYSVRVRAVDLGGLELVHVLDLVVVDANDAPTDLTLTGGKIGENQEAGAVGGLFDAVDEDGDAITYTLVLVDGETPGSGVPAFRDRSECSQECSHAGS